MQIIAVVECSEENQTDSMYIKPILNYRYNLRSDKLSFVYLDGKSKFTRDKISKQIDKLIKSYSKTGQSQVVVFLDYDSNGNPDNRKIKKICDEKEYKIVWFNKDIEDVILGNTVKSKDKVQLAKQFFVKPNLEKFDFSRLENEYCNSSRHTSNLAFILDDILTKN